MPIDYGFVVHKPLNEAILAYFGITKDTDVGINGYEVEYQGKPYVIMQRDYWMPPSDTNPDGVHFVYSPSQEEIELDEAGDIDYSATDPFSEALGLGKGIVTIAGLGIAAYLIVNILGFFKKK